MSAGERRSASARRLRVRLGGPAEIEVELGQAELADIKPAGPAERLDGMSSDSATPARRNCEVVVDGWRFEASVEPAGQAALRDRALRVAARHGSAATITLRAQIPGRVVRLWVADGEQVEQGQRLLAIEAMKMENEIRAPHAGVVGGLGVEVGRLVERGDELLRIDQP
ncbi:MAG TPA: biotin/lipoyl-containing protein [Candidatus Limnocylindria bacterium]|nr:biotin/lipoyl-containing protein [Candidatus Limnocylindria bacterium]